MSSLLGHCIRRALSTEGFDDGKPHREYEYTFYVKLSDMSQLDKADHVEEHEQWKIPVDTEANARMRIRLTDNRRATITTKEFQDNERDAKEITEPIGHDMFAALRRMGKDGYKKTRHCFKIPNSDRIWEIDVFMSKTGTPHPWVKIDYEIDPENPHSIPELPLDIEDSFLDNGPKQTLEQKRFVRKLWREEWLRLDDGFAPTPKTPI